MHLPDKCIAKGVTNVTKHSQGGAGGTAPFKFVVFRKIRQHTLWPIWIVVNNETHKKRPLFSKFGVFCREIWVCTQGTKTTGGGWFPKTIAFLDAVKLTMHFQTMPNPLTYQSPDSQSTFDRGPLILQHWSHFCFLLICSGYCRLISFNVRLISFKLKINCHISFW